MSNTQVIWAPQRGPQESLVNCPHSEIFFGGARGGGKTDGVLGKWALKEQRYGENFNAIMFRRTTVSSDDAIERAKEIYLPLGASYVDKAGGLFRMPNGGRVSFRYLENISDADEYQGRNVTDVWVEEVGQYAFSDPIDRLFGVLRSAKGVPTQLILTGNPGGSGQHWISARYGLIPFPKKPTVGKRLLPNGETHHFAVIPSRIGDNKILLNSDPEYINRLYMVGGPALVKAWLEGDWSAIEGAFFDVWSSKNIVRPFKIPEHWTKFRSFDWGYAAPFSVGWWAVASDDYETEELTIPMGSMVRYREWYGASGPNKGIRMEAEDIARGILERETEDGNVSNGPADPSIFSGDRGPSIFERMLKAGVSFTRADNKRVGASGFLGGWDQVRERIKSYDIIDGQPVPKNPSLYVFNTCKDFIRTVPVLQHDIKKPEDLDTTAEDHIADETRYACMSRPFISAAPKKLNKITTRMPTFDEMMAEMERKRRNGA